MTDTQAPFAPYTIEGPVKVCRYGSVGFELADPLAPALCRRATADLLTSFDLTWVPDLVDDCATMVTELVTNACRHAQEGSEFPAGSLTIWHPNRWLIITVHDKSPYVPYRETYRGVPDPTDIRWGLGQAQPGKEPFSAWAEGGRGLALVRGLAAAHIGELDWARDNTTGKVARVKMLLPDVMWRHTFTDPWTGRVVVGRA